MRKRATYSGSLKRLTIWVLLIATWEAGYRIVQWEPSKFPAPSQVLDGALSLANIQTTFGQPLHDRWPRPARDLYPAEREGLEAYRAGKTLADNPHKSGTEESVDWRLGFESGSQNFFNSKLVQGLLV